MATVRIKKICDTVDKKWGGSNKGLVVGAAFVIPIPRVPVVPPVTTIPKPDPDTGNFSSPSLPKVPSAQDLANGIVGWFIGDYIQKITEKNEAVFNPKNGTTIRKGNSKAKKDTGYLQKDGSVWSQDDGASHGGSSWKKYKNKIDFEKGKREGTYDEKGNKLRD